MKDYYKTLEINLNATETEIKKSYRRLAKKYHPDRNQGAKSSEENFKKINEAYETLSDKQRKQSYDYLLSLHYYKQTNDEQKIREPKFNRPDKQTKNKKNWAYIFWIIIAVVAFFYFLSQTTSTTESAEEDPANRPASGEIDFFNK